MLQPAHLPRSASDVRSGDRPRRRPISFGWCPSRRSGASPCRPADQDLRGLWAPPPVAETVEGRLGRGEVLLRAVPRPPRPSRRDKAPWCRV